MSERVVVDTSVFVAAMRSRQGASREILRLCLRGDCQPLMGQKLYIEYEAVLGRAELIGRSGLSEAERSELLDAFMSVCEWTQVFFLWRPNLPDEADNHLVELAVAGSATKLITHNLRDFRLGELRFPQLQVVNPATFLKLWRQTHGDDDDPNS